MPRKATAAKAPAANSEATLGLSGALITGKPYCLGGTGSIGAFLA